MANLYVFASLDSEKTNLEFYLCVICQKGEKNVLDFAKEWASYGNKQYSEIDR